jgi:hypothetical protein
VRNHSLRQSNLILTSFVELSLGKNSLHRRPPHERKSSQKKSETTLIDFKNSESLQSLGLVAVVVLLTVILYFYYKMMFEKKMRGQLESSRDGIEGRYRMIGYSR